MNTVSQNTVVLFQSYFNKSRDLKQLKAKKSKTNVRRLTHDLTQHRPVIMTQVWLSFFHLYKFSCYKTVRDNKRNDDRHY